MTFILGSLKQKNDTILLVSDLTRRETRECHLWSWVHCRVPLRVRVEFGFLGVCGPRVPLLQQWQRVDDRIQFRDSTNFETTKPTNRTNQGML